MMYDDMTQKNMNGFWYTLSHKRILRFLVCIFENNFKTTFLLARFYKKYKYV